MFTLSPKVEPEYYKSLNFYISACDANCKICDTIGDTTGLCDEDECMPNYAYNKVDQKCESRIFVLLCMRFILQKQYTLTC